MTRRRSALVAAAFSVLTWTASGACVTTTAVVRPSPFPGAPAPESGRAARPREPLTSPAVLGEVVRTALSLRGVPYRLGGSVPETGFDCSGLVQFAFEQHDIALPRTVEEQFRAGQRVALQSVRAGDLIFFATTTAEPSHVGLVVDDTTFVHAPDVGGVVRLESFTTEYWRARFAGARRIDGPALGTEP
jgi:cell wall-associated NlpC family hydrolase